MALFVAVRRKRIDDLNGDGVKNLFDSFPLPAQLVCRSEDKNEFEPNFKCHVMQVVLLRHGDQGKRFALVLIGLNFDTADSARLEQVKALERLLQSYEREERKFTAVIFGDFNNRIVCWKELAPHAEISDGSRLKKGTPVLSSEGVKILCAKIRDMDGRKELFTEKDSWFYTGMDAMGTEVSPPPSCVKLRELFNLHTECLGPNGPPLPTYKRTPIGEWLSQDAGFIMEPMELIMKDQLSDNVQHLRDTHLFDDPEVAFFSWGGRQRKVHVPEFGPPKLECGWPDGIGAYRHGVGVDAELIRWEVCTNLYTGSHVPIRGVVNIKLRPDRNLKRGFP